MRVLKYAILGLLRKGELSGYDITSYFKEELGQFWSAKHSQIYPELKKLTDEGFITFRTTIQGTKLEKKMYTLTDSGKQELHDWLIRHQPIPETVKDEFMLKLISFLVYRARRLLICSKTSCKNARPSFLTYREAMKSLWLQQSRCHFLHRTSATILC